MLENSLEKSGAKFLFGVNYTLVDVVYTCLLARLNMIGLLENLIR